MWYPSTFGQRRAVDVGGPQGQNRGGCRHRCRFSRYASENFGAVHPHDAAGLLGQADHLLTGGLQRAGIAERAVCSRPGGGIRGRAPAEL